jgi:hypothetical protein
MLTLMLTLMLLVQTYEFHPQEDFVGAEDDEDAGAPPPVAAVVSMSVQQVVALVGLSIPVKETKLLPKKAAKTQEDSP